MSNPVVKQIPDFSPDGMADAFGELGTLGLDIQGGRILDDVLPNLQNGRDRAKVFRSMMTDATVHAVLFAIEMLIRQVKWTVRPAEPGNPVDEENAEFLDQCLGDMTYTWDTTLGHILSMNAFGYSLMEEVYKVRNGPTDDPATTSAYEDGRVGWRKLAPRAQETIDLWHVNEDTQEVEGVRQLGPPDWKIRDIPASRFLLFHPLQSRGNPEGVSLIRAAYKSWYFKERIERIEGIGVERDLAGLPVMMVPPKILHPDASAQDRAIFETCKEIVRNVRNDEKAGLVIPMGRDVNGNLEYEFKLVSTGGRRQFDTSAIVTRWDRRIAQTVLAQFILLGQETTGSFALAESQTDLFAVAIGAILESIEDVFRRTAIPRLFRMNALDTRNGFPSLEAGDIESVDLSKLADYVSKLVTAGAILVDDDLERDLRERGDLPPPQEGRPEPSAPMPPASTGAGAPVAQGDGEVPGGGEPDDEATAPE